MTERDAHIPIKSAKAHTTAAVPNVHAALYTTPASLGMEKVSPYLMDMTAGTIMGPINAPAMQPKKVIAALMKA